MNYNLLTAVLLGMLLLISLIILLRIPAFIALLLSSIVTSLLSGMDPVAISETIKTGMGSTLGFVATVVGLGAIFGGVLEKSGGANAIAQYLISKAGESKANLALLISGFIIGIPVFFDVGIIIMFPMIAALHKKTGKSIVYYAIPLLSGLAVTHTFIPPTPGPMAVTELIGANLGWVIFMGLIAGIPAALMGGYVFGKYIGEKINIQLDLPLEISDAKPDKKTFRIATLLVLMPIILIVIGTITDMNLFVDKQSMFGKLVLLIGHPFTALILANIFAWYFLGIKRGFTKEDLLKISNKSLQPAGIIILVTGAGGVFKQVLVDTGAGKMIAESLQSAGVGVLLFSFLAATIIRLLQGSATVAMITAAGLVAPLLTESSLLDSQLAAIVISIASGATMASHVNDSGFWLIKEYMQMSEKQGFRTWTVASTIIGITGFFMAFIIFYFSSLF